MEAEVKGEVEEVVDEAERRRGLLLDDDEVFFMQADALRKEISEEDSRFLSELFDFVNGCYSEIGITFCTTTYLKEMKRQNVPLDLAVAQLRGRVLLAVKEGLGSQ